MGTILPIMQTGAFTRQTRDTINGNFAALSQPDIWVRPQDGDNASADGSYARPYASMAGAFGSPLFKPGVVIGLQGVLLEEATTPIVNDITIVGIANQPRQATTSSVPNGGGATWLSPSGGTGTLLKVRGQAWTVQGIYFNNSATAAPCVDLLLEGDPPTSADAGHARLIDCVFTGADDGVTVTGGTSFVSIINCVFFNFTGTGDTAIKAVAGLGIGTNWGYLIEGCRFYNNANHLVAPLHNATLVGNTFTVHGLNTTTSAAVNFTNGSGNVVMGNYLGDAATGATATWTGGTNDTWCNFTSDDGVASGVPS